jgi:predicted nucleotidyltransferase
MITVAEAFDTFRQRLELSATESEDAQRRHKEVRECIRAAFEVDRDFLTGSYARHTKTKPLKDVDIFFVLGPNEKHWRSEPPSQILGEFEKCLAKTYGQDQVERGRRCVTVELDKKNQTQDSDGKVLSIDAVPAFDAGSHYEIPDGTLGQWITSDPDIHKEEATAKNKQLGGKWVPFVKMLKRWNRQVDKPIKPMFLVEVMAQDLVDPPFNSYPDEAQRFFSAAQDGIEQDWPDPAGLGPPVSDQMDAAKRSAAKQALRDAERLAVQAMHAEQQGRVGDALQLWRQVFGRYFPTS